MAHNWKDLGSIPMRGEGFFTMPYMDVIGQPHKQLGAEVYYYVMIDTPNGMPSDLKFIAEGLRVRRETNI